MAEISDADRRAPLLADLDARREQQIARGYTVQHDRDLGSHRLIIEAMRRVSTSECGYYHLDDVLDAAAVLIAAAEVIEGGTDDGHDGPHGFLGKAKR